MKCQIAPLERLLKRLKEDGHTDIEVYTDPAEVVQFYPTGSQLTKQIRSAHIYKDGRVMIVMGEEVLEEEKK